MPPKLEKFNQRLQELLNILDSHNATDSSLTELQTMVQAVQQRGQDARLSLHLLGKNPSLLQAWQTQLSMHPGLQDSYIITHHSWLHSSQGNEYQSDWFDCDVLIFVQDSVDEWLQEQIQRSRDRPIAQRILVTVLKSEDDNNPAIAADLKPALDETIVSDPDSPDPSYAKLQKKLESIVRRRPGDILAQRLMSTVLPVFDAVEQYLTHAHQTCNETIQQLRSRLDATATPNASHLDAIQSTQARFNEQFKRIETALRQSRAGILDEYNRHSLTYNIQTRTEQLQPVIIRRRGAQYLQLQSNLASNSTEINMDMMQLCYGYLSRWMIDEWRRVYTIYGDGGLNHLYQLVRRTFPEASISLPDSEANLSQQLSQVGRSFQDCVAPVHCETYLKESSIGNYLVRQLRNQWMGIMFIMTFIGMIGIGGGSRSEMMKAFFSPILQLKDNPVWLFIALAIPLCLIFLFLFNSYYVSNACKVEESAEKLKKQVRGYYQGFSKHITDKLVLDIVDMLQTEHHRLVALLDQVQVQQQLRLAEHECQTQSLQNKVEECLLNQKQLQQTLTSVQRLRRF